MDTRRFWVVVIVVVLAVGGVCWFFLSPSGQQTVQAIDNTAEAVTGKQALDQSQQMRREIKGLSSEHKEQLRDVGLSGDSTER